MQLIIVKNRSGKLGEINLICDFSSSTIEDIPEYADSLNDTTFSSSEFIFSNQRLNEINEKEYDDEGENTPF